MSALKSAQIEQPIKELKPDYSHRLAFTSLSSEQSLTDSIGLMTDRALGVLHLLSLQFENNDRLSDALICGAIDSVIQEVVDIKELARAFDIAVHAKHQA